jgi:hypothetical protein
VLLPSARRCSALRSRSVVSRGDSWSLQPEPRRETLWVKLLVDFEDLRGRAWITGHDDGRLATSGNTGSLLARRESGLQPRPPAYSLHSRRFSSIPGDSRQSPAILVNPRRFSSIPGDSRQSPAILVNPRAIRVDPRGDRRIERGIDPDSPKLQFTCEGIGEFDDCQGLDCDGLCVVDKGSAPADEKTSAGHSSANRQQARPLVASPRQQPPWALASLAQRFRQLGWRNHSIVRHTDAVRRR